MTPHEWTRFARLWLQDEAFRGEIAAGRMEAALAAGFDFDATDLDLVQDFIAAAGGAEMAARSGPWDWAGYTSPGSAEWVVNYEGTRKAGSDDHATRDWNRQMANELRRPAAVHPVTEEMIQKFGAMAALQDGLTATYRFASAWKTQAAAEAYKKMLEHTVAGFPDPHWLVLPVNPTTPILVWELFRVNVPHFGGIGEGMIVVRCEKSAPPGIAIALEADLTPLFTNITGFPGAVGYHGGGCLRRTAGGVTTYQLFVGFKGVTVDEAQDRTDSVLAGTSWIEGRTPPAWILRNNQIGKAFGAGAFA